MLSDPQKHAFERDGYLVLPGFKSTADIEAVRLGMSERRRSRSRFDPTEIGRGPEQVTLR